METNAILESYNSPIVNITFNENAMSRFDYNGFEVTEEFSQYDEFKECLKLSANRIIEEIRNNIDIDYLKALRKKLKLIERNFFTKVEVEFLRVKNQEITKTIYVHSNIVYNQNGDAEYRKTIDNEWSNFHPNELSYFIEEQYGSLQLILIQVHKAISLYQIKKPTQEQSTKPIQLKVKEVNQEVIYENLKDYFIDQDHNKLNSLIKGEVLNDSITFQSNGNQLGDTFRRLKDYNVIISSKSDIIEWIVQNFKYKSNKEKSNFDKMALQSIINTKNCPSFKCKNPISYFENQYPSKNK